MRKAIVAVAIVFLACIVAAALVSRRTAASSRSVDKSRSAVDTSTSSPGETSTTGSAVDQAQAIAIAEDLAIKDANNQPVLSQPSNAQSMSFSDAEADLGSGADYSLPADATVWLVHVYGSFGAPLRQPPRPRWATTTTDATTTTGATTTPPIAANYSVIIDAATGRVVIENY